MAKADPDRRVAAFRLLASVNSTTLNLTVCGHVILQSVDPTPLFWMLVSSRLEA
jgi:hypothetical protein